MLEWFKYFVVKDAVWCRRRHLNTKYSEHFLQIWMQLEDWIRHGPLDTTNLEGHGSGPWLYCTCTAALLSLCCFCTLFTLPYYFHRTFNNYTGGQSVIFVLLWQPSDCIDLFVIDDIFVLFSENKCVPITVTRYSFFFAEMAIKN